MAFLDKVKPVKVQIMGSRLAPEERCRAKMIGWIRKQSSPKKAKRSWFITVGDQEVFTPRYANVNIVQYMTGGKKNAYPVYKTRKTTLRLFSKDIEAGKNDSIILAGAQERSQQLTGQRRREGGSRALEGFGAQGWFGAPPAG